MSFVCTGWGTYPGACVGSVFQEQAPSCVPAFKRTGDVGTWGRGNRGLGHRGPGTWGYREVRTCGRGDAGRGDVGTWGRGDAA